MSSFIEFNLHQLLDFTEVYVKIGNKGGATYYQLAMASQLFLMDLQSGSLDCNSTRVLVYGGDFEELNPVRELLLKHCIAWCEFPKR